MTGAQIAAARLAARTSSRRRTGRDRAFSGFFGVLMYGAIGLSDPGARHAALRRRTRRPPEALVGLPDQLPVADHPGELRHRVRDLGTLWLMVICAVIVVPLGIATAIYLEEFADRDASGGTASSRSTSRTSPPFPRSSTASSASRSSCAARSDLGRTLLAGGITLALLVLPVVIIVSREAIRAVPSSIREGSLALGATQWQTIWKQVLPGLDCRHRDRRDPRALARDR